VRCGQYVGLGLVWISPLEEPPWLTKFELLNNVDRQLWLHSSIRLEFMTETPPPMFPLIQFPKFSTFRTSLSQLTSNTEDLNPRDFSLSQFIDSPELPGHPRSLVRTRRPTFNSRIRSSSKCIESILLRVCWLRKMAWTQLLPQSLQVHSVPLSFCLSSLALSPEDRAAILPASE
jgi:hypothetical protein